MTIFNILNEVYSWHCAAALCLYNFGMLQQKRAQQNTQTTTLHCASYKYLCTSGKHDGVAAQHCSGTGQSFKLSILLLACIACAEPHLLSPMHQSCGSSLWERTENTEPRHAGQSHMLLLNMHAQKRRMIYRPIHLIFLQHSLVVSGTTLLQAKKTSTCAQSNIFFQS